MDAYLSSILDRLGGYVSVEFPTGNGKVDLWLFLNGHRYVVEVKNYVDESSLLKAKSQAAQYAKSEGLAEAYLVVFVEKKERIASSAKNLFEELDGVKLYTFMLAVA